MSRHSPQLYGFSGSVSIQKTGLALAFFLSSSNRNRGKAFAVLSKKKVGTDPTLNMKLAISQHCYSKSNPPC
jgi:hypothetical protein